MNTPLQAIAETHKIIWAGKFLDGNLTLLTEKNVDRDIAECTVTFIMEGADNFQFVGQAVATNSKAGLDNLLTTIEKEYKQAVLEDAIELQEVYGAKLN